MSPEMAKNLARAAFANFKDEFRPQIDEFCEAHNCQCNAILFGIVASAYVRGQHDAKEFEQMLRDEYLGI